MADQADRVQGFLKNWHIFVDDQRFDMLDDLIAEDARLLSPAFWKPRQGRDNVAAVLRAVAGIFEDFHYTKEWLDGDEILLEFEARIGALSVRGIDRITLNADGRLGEIEVMVRPMNGLMALVGEMGKALGPDALKL
jgi:SnoaL-like domain